MSKEYTPKVITCQKEDCFAYYKGVCVVLTCTEFKGRECPFYKQKEVKDEDTRVG